MNFSCEVHNVGPVAGDEVVQVYHSVGAEIRAAANHPVPLRSLVQFERLSLALGESATVDFSLPMTAFALVTANGNRTIYHGNHSVVFSRGHGQEVVIPITV